MSNEILVNDDDDDDDKSPIRAVRQGSGSNNVRFQMLSPIDADIEANELVKHVLGQLPIIDNKLLPKQKVFLQAYYNTLFDIASSCNTAGISVNQYRDWLSYDNDFVVANNMIVDLIKSKTHSIAIKQAFYERDNKMLIKLMESYFPDTYAPVEKDDKLNEVDIMSEALRNLE